MTRFELLRHGVARFVATSGAIGSLAATAFWASPASAAMLPCGAPSPVPVPVSTWKFAPRPAATPKSKYSGCKKSAIPVRSVKPTGSGVPPQPGTVNGHG